MFGKSLLSCERHRFFEKNTGVNPILLSMVKRDGHSHQKDRKVNQLATSNENAFVKFDRVQKSYDGETLVVKDLNLELPKGEFLTMLGPSGSGKTTCLMMLAGFETPTHGEILLDGISINNIPPHKRGIGMVFQNYALFPHMTVAENLAFPLEVRNISKSDREAKIMRALDMVEMGSFASRRPAQLSGGQQQRIALARALVFEPELVLMDEPLGALDALTREKMQSLILELWKKTSKTIIVITHSVEEALLLGERLFVMAPRPGRIHREYRLPFAEMGLTQSLRAIKQEDEFSKIREEILTMIWDMEEEIMGNV